MRKVMLLAVIVLAVAALSSSATAVPTQVDVSYATFAPGAPAGILSFENAEGRTFQAFDIYGALVLDGVVQGPMWDTFCPNGGADESGVMLNVHVQPNLWFSLGGDGDDPEDFHWDR